MMQLKSALLSISIVLTSIPLLGQVQNEWEKVYEGGTEESVSCVAKLSNGDFVLAGYQVKDGTGNKDGWVCRLDNAGEVIWEKTFGGKYEDIFGGIDVSEGDKIFLAGSKSESYSMSKDFWIMCLSQSGEVVWDKSTARMYHDDATSISALIDGSVVVAGHGDFEGRGEYNIRVIKFRSNGKVEWKETLGGPRADFAKKIKFLRNGDLIVAGLTKSTADKSFNAYVAKLNPEGKVIWQNNYGGNGKDAASDFIIMDDGSLVIVGSTTNNNTIANDFWVFKLDSYGTKLWEKTFGNLGDDYATAIQEIDNGFVVCGYTKELGLENNHPWIFMYCGSASTGTKNPFSVFTSGAPCPE